MRTLLILVGIAIGGCDGATQPADCTKLSFADCAGAPGCQQSSSYCTCTPPNGEGPRTSTSCHQTMAPSLSSGPACATLAEVDCLHRDDCAVFYSEAVPGASTFNHCGAN